MLELRVLSGMHRGAVMTLDEKIQSQYRVGSHEYADMLLLDHGIEPEHFTIQWNEDERIWQLHTTSSIREEDGTYLLSPKNIQRLLRFYLAGIWLGFADQNDEWDVLEPIPSSEFIQDKPLDMSQFLTQNAMDAAQNITIPKPSPTQDHALKEQDTVMDFKSKILAMLGLLSLAGWATANVFFTDGHHLTHSQNIEKPAPLTQNLAMQARAEEKAKQITYDEQALTQLFNQNMMALDIQHYDLSQENKNLWTLEGSFDNEDMMRIERMIQSFQDKYQPKFSIQVRLLAKKDLLNFKIAQVMYGKLASVITQDGQRIFIGDTINGYRLIAIQNQKAIFEGEQKIEVAL